MSLFVSVNVHQDRQYFSIKCKSEQFAFMSLSWRLLATLTADMPLLNNRVIDWSVTTLNKVLEQRNNIYCI